MHEAFAAIVEFKEEFDEKHKEGELVVEKYLKKQYVDHLLGNIEIDPLSIKLKIWKNKMNI